MRIIDRLDQYIKFKGINDNQVTVNANLSTGLLNNARKGSTDLGKKAIEKILNFYQDLNRVWLITGDGAMIKEETVVPVSQIFPLQSDHSIPDLQRIPLYEINATAGLVAIFQETVPVPEDFISVPGLPAVDGAIYVRGDSMSPVLKSGDIVIYKKMELNEGSILWGHIYLLSYSILGDSYTVVKYLRHAERDGYVRLVSANDFYDPVEIPSAAITAIALVKASITFHTIG